LRLEGPEKGLKVRNMGDEPSILVRTFGQFTNTFLNIERSKCFTSQSIICLESTSEPFLDEMAPPAFARIKKEHIKQDVNIIQQ